MQAWSLFAALLVVVVPSLPFHLWIRYLLRISWGTAGLMSISINVITATTLFLLAAQHDARWHDQNPPLHILIEQRLKSDNAPLYVAAILILANLAIALAAKVYRAAILSKATPQEQASGVAGFRAWLSPLNVITVLCIAVSAYIALDYDYFAVSIMGICALLAYPLINTVSQQSIPATTAPDAGMPLKAPAEERQRVLALVESGKISAEDGAELLTALAQSQAASANGPGDTVSGARRVMLVGAAVVLVGFFLPWFTLNITTGLSEMINGARQSFALIPGGVVPVLPQPAPADNSMQGPVANMTQTTVRGGDVQHGLGWMILAAALVAACLPFFWISPGAEPRHLRNATLAILAVGSVIAIYVLSGSFNAITSIEPGFVLAMAGYAIVWIGTLREHFTLPARLHPAVAAV
jgi:hypothetical protein